MSQFKTRKTRIVCISDTHNQTPKLPPGNVLIHAGDLTNQGSFSELQKTVEWLEKADFEAKIVVAGNLPSQAQSLDEDELTVAQEITTPHSTHRFSIQMRTNGNGLLHKTPLLAGSCC